MRGWKLTGALRQKLAPQALEPTDLKYAKYGINEVLSKTT